MVFRALFVLLTMLLVPATALAQSTIDLSQIKDVARAKAEEGLALFAEKSWAEAYERFRVAEELFHAPTLGLHMGHCKRELGELMAARALYRKVAAEELPEDAPPAFRKALEEAAAHASALDAEIPRVTISVTGASEPRVTVDGTTVALAPETVELDPGKHRLDAVAPGVEAYSREIELAPGTREDITVVLTRVVIERPKPIVVPQPVPDRPIDPGTLVPAFVAFGVGAGGLIAGAVAGGIALSRVTDIQDQCEGNVCPDRLLDAADQAQLASTVSNIGFIVGGVGVIAGTVLVFVRPGAGDAPTTSFHVGPTSARFEVRF